MEFVNILQMYAAFWIVVFLHELGHRPTTIKYSFFPFPSAAAMQAEYRIGGLMVNVLLFIVIAYFQPQTLFIQMVGLLAWLHFILYAILGSLLPEPKPSQVNLRTFVWDDVPNEFWWVWIPAAFVSYLYFQSYYVPILMGLI